MSNATNSEPTTPRNLPAPAEMLEMLNVDILPFFDTYETTTFAFVEKYRAVAITSETPRTITVALNNAIEIEISTIYFQFPRSEKTSTIKRLQGTFS
jgi:hypothetical protein